MLAEVKALGLEKRVKFIGYRRRQRPAAPVSRRAAFAFPSTYEGFGLPPLEAMACGVPVVTSNASSLPEVVGDAGAQVDPLDVDGLAAALERAVRDETWRATAIARGMARARDFTWPRAARRLLEVYARALGRPVQSAA